LSVNKIKFSKESSYIKIPVKSNTSQNEKFYFVFFNRNLKIKGQNLLVIEEFIEKFKNTLEELCLSIFHICNHNVNDCFDGNRSSNLCEKLIESYTSIFFSECFLSSCNESYNWSYAC